MNDEKKVLKPELERGEFSSEDVILTSNVLDSLDEDSPVEH